MRNLPFAAFEHNQVWLELSLLAQWLLSWGPVARPLTSIPLGTVVSPCMRTEAQGRDWRSPCPWRRRGWSCGAGSAQ